MIVKQSDTMAYMSETSVRILGRYVLFAINNGNSISLLIYNFNEFLFLWVIRVSIKRTKLTKYTRDALCQLDTCLANQFHGDCRTFTNFCVVRVVCWDAIYWPGTGFIQVIDQEAVTVCKYRKIMGCWCFLTLICLVIFVSVHWMNAIETTFHR